MLYSSISWTLVAHAKYFLISKTECLCKLRADYRLFHSLLTVMLLKCWNQIIMYFLCVVQEQTCTSIWYYWVAFNFTPLHIYMYIDTWNSIFRPCAVGQTMFSYGRPHHFNPSLNCVFTFDSFSTCSQVLYDFWKFEFLIVSLAGNCVPIAVSPTICNSYCDIKCTLSVVCPLCTFLQPVKKNTVQQSMPLIIWYTLIQTYI